MTEADIRAEIAEAIKAHGAWKMTLRRAAGTGRLDKPVAEIRADTLCRFGGWLREVATRDTVMALDPDFREIKRLHTRFHRAAGEVAAMIEKGETGRVERELSAGAFHSTSEELKSALMAWRTRL